uniref:Guanine deaminase n=1 Tax=Astyanax mexicanus TaxID=7994 RepID=A0A3B1K021_ASTMX
MPVSCVYRGTLAHSTRDTPLQILEDSVLGVDHRGKIAFIEEGQNVESLSQTWGFETSDIVQLGQYEFLMPGMVDTHIHASQYSYSGTALDLPLLDWLNTYTFPVESGYKDLDFARDVYTKVLKRTLRNGTTTACYFATIHTDASLLLGQIADDFGQRALVGKVCMDCNSMVPYYKESLEECKDETLRFIQELLRKEYARVKPVVTPRFAVSCSSSLLHTLGEIAKNNDLHIQSHISENKEEVKLVKQLFPDCRSYTDVYLKHDLLTPKTVMAHGCYLSDEELKIFHERGAAISHCPNSNTSLASGMLNVRNVLNHKVKLGLGTVNFNLILYEFSELNILHSIAWQNKQNTLSLDDQTGNFEVGKDFDALRVNMCVPEGPVDVFPGQGPKVILEKFLNLGDDRNIVEVFVAGRRVVPFPE